MATLRMNCVAVNSQFAVDHRSSSMHGRSMLLRPLVGMSPIGGVKLLHHMGSLGINCVAALNNSREVDLLKVQHHHMGSLRIGDLCGFGHHHYAGFKTPANGGNFAAPMCTSSSSASDPSDNFDDFCITCEQDWPLLGRITEIEGFENDPEYENLARFAVDEHNKRQMKKKKKKKQDENGVLEFHKLVNVKYQCVAGAMLYLTLEASDAGGHKKVYEAKVWDQPWINFKQLQRFKHIRDA